MDINDDKKMNLKEFRDFGFLQEVNRNFFHPLGLAMGVYWDENDLQNKQGFDTENEEPIGIIIWDWRDDAEGGAFQTLDDDDSRSKADRVENLRAEIAELRQSSFGWVVQPIGHSFVK